MDRENLRKLLSNARTRNMGAKRPIVQAVARRASPPFKSQLETRYAQHLDIMVRAGELQMWEYEAIGFRLGDDCFYYPDFLLVTSTGGIQLHECKGYIRDDARVKFRAAAQRWPFFRWVIVTSKGGTFCLESYD